jgi:hypothetical protein
LGLKVAVAIFTLLELLNRSLQAETATVSWMLKAVENVIAELNDLRNAETFHDIMNDVDRMVDSHGLYEVCVPRVRRPPRRYCGPAEAHVAESAEEYYRAAFYSVIDTAIMQLCDRFATEGTTTGLCTYLQLEDTLLSGTVLNICMSYPELTDPNQSLTIQLKMFRSQFPYNNL